ncbi:MAG: non-canonical purine NTP pyrophosphatase, RdgB/HAM1 family [Candidatus Omnitrophota bacterium]|nr:MAG: non-canonical purine NTP pyrophosphatase, RdgB/HAM1 family [Candidatus Omnitrophota bacterium]
MRLRVFLATKNENKVREIREIVEDGRIEILPCPENIVLPEEKGNSFEENAYIKASFLSKFLKGEIVVGEDSGLCVEKLKGLPGVYSARFSGKGDKENIEKLLKLMSPYKKIEERKAKFITVVCLITGREKKFFKGEVEGFITFTPRGIYGFGYDPVFEIMGKGKTFAEMEMEEKNKISHRAIAFKKLERYLVENYL